MDDQQLIREALERSVKAVTLKPAIGKRGRKQGDGPGDRTPFLESPQAPRDGRGRQRHSFGQLVGRPVGVLLHQVEQLKVEIVEHPPNLANFWRARPRI